MADIGQHYCLRWNNYQSNMTSVFYQLLRTEAFVDVTLNCNENSLKAHKVVLSACSSYFQKLLMDNPCKHPTIILPQEIDFNDLKFIIEFVYRGEIDVSHSELQSLLKTADQLKIKGLCEVSEGDDENEINSEKSIIDVGLFGAHILHDKSPSKSKLVARYRCGGGGGRYISTSATSTATTTMSGGGGTTQTQTQTQQLHQKRKLPAQEMNSARKYCAKENKPVEHSTAVAATTTTTTTTTTTAVAAAAAASMQLIQTTTINANDNMLDRTNNHQQYHNLQPANCITVATSTEEDEKDLKPRPSVNNANLPAVVILDNRHPQQMAVSSAMHYLHENPSAQQCHQAEKMIMTTNSSPIMNSSCTTLTTLQPQPPLLLDHQSSHRQHLSVQPSTTSDDDKRDVEIIAETQPLGPTATPVHCHSIEMQQHSPAHRDIAVDTSGMPPDEMKVKFETLRTMDQASDSMDTIENHMSEHSMNDDEHTMQTMMITPELFTMMPSTSSAPPSEVGSDNGKGMGMSKKDWTQEDMEAALDALRNHHMSLTKASSTYGIPSTTLWQRAHRLGIDTPKKDGTTKSWNEDVLNIALDALRNGTLSANKASKTFGIPSSTLYKIARREGIRLAAPFNAAPTTWSQDDLERALDAIRTGQTTVQKAATEYGIPTGTLYGRCKREKIELSRSNPTPWSQDAMSEALEAIRLGHMSINQASIHYNLPYSSLYGRFRRGKYEADHPDTDEDSINVEVQPSAHQSMMHHAAEIQVEQQQQHTQSGTQTPSQPPQPQIMLLQYQHAPATHIQMYQPAAPS